MPKLPDASSLGGLPGFNSGRPIATYDVSAADAGVTALGQGMQNAGEKVGEVAQRNNDANDNLAYMRGKTVFLPKNIQIQNGFKDDNDYNTFQQRYEEEANKAREEAAAGINNPRLRQKFLMETADDVARGSVTVHGMAKSREADVGRATLYDGLTNLRSQLPSAATDADRAALIDTANGSIATALDKQYITAERAAELRRKFPEEYAKDWFNSLPNGLKVEAARGTSLDQSRIDQINRSPVRSVIETEAARAGMDPNTLKVLAHIESGGNPDASTGSYKGLFQLSGDEFSKYGETGASINDPVANTRAAIGSLKDKQTNFERQYGRLPSATELYLMHQQGEGGLAAQLAHPDQPAWQNMASTAEGRQKGEAWAKQAIWGNVPADVRAQFPGGVDRLTGAQFMAIWAKKVQGTPYDQALAAAQNGEPVGGRVAPLLKYIPPGELRPMVQQAEIAHSNEVIQASSARDDQWTRAIVDANAGKAPLPARSQIENDPALTEKSRNTLLAQYDRANSDAIETQKAMAKFRDNSATYNPFDKDDRDGADRVFNNLGGDVKALQTVADRTGMVPPSAGAMLRGGLVSSDPAKVQTALTTASNLMTRSPGIFAKLDGAKDITDAALTYRHDVEDLGFTGAEAAQRYTERMTPEYQAKAQTRLKNEDLNDVVKKNVAASDIAKAFDTSWFFQKAPGVGFDNEQRQAMLSDYQELFRDSYRSGPSIGDVSAAKSIALDQFKKTWGVTKISGSDVVMKFPPELAPAYRGIADAPTKIADQAIAGIKAETGESVDRKQLMFIPVPGGQTSAAYWAGEPPPYTIGWRDKNGVAHVMPRAFVADPKEILTAQSAERGQEFEKARHRADEARPTAPGNTGWPTLSVVGKPGTVPPVVPGFPK